MNYQEEASGNVRSASSASSVVERKAIHSPFTHLKAFFSCYYVSRILVALRLNTPDSLSNEIGACPSVSDDRHQSVALHNIINFHVCSARWYRTISLYLRPLVRTDKTYHLPRSLWQLNHISTFLQELIRIEIHNSSIGSEGHFSKIDLAI